MPSSASTRRAADLNWPALSCSVFARRTPARRIVCRPDHPTLARVEMHRSGLGGGAVVLVSRVGTYMALHWPDRRDLKHAWRRAECAYQARK